MPEPKDPKRDALYRVAHTQVGPWPQGHVFTAREFARLHPLPDNPQTRDAGLWEDGPDAYHDGLIRRLLDLGAIAAAEPQATAEPTPLGPENRVPPPRREDVPPQTPAVTHAPAGPSPAPAKK